MVAHTFPLAHTHTHVLCPSAPILSSMLGFSLKCLHDKPTARFGQQRPIPSYPNLSLSGEWACYGINLSPIIHLPEALHCVPEAKPLDDTQVLYSLFTPQKNLHRQMSNLLRPRERPLKSQHHLPCGKVMPMKDAET